MAQDTRIGTTMGGYRIERLVGRGGMGRVYLAEDIRLGRKVALKLLDPELAEDERFRDRFVRESRLAASLDHPNVVPIYEAGEHDGVLFIAMRFVEGTDLARVIEDEGPLAPQRAASIVTQVAAALDAAHERGLVHRDVKPGNILVGRGDHTYLTDFGLIKRRDGETGLTRTGQFMGSVDYAAPEQIRGEAVGPGADVYSLGCVLFECFTGEPPYPLEAELAVLYAHLNDPPPSAAARRPGLPPALDPVVAKAMAKSPDDRYQSAGALAEAVRDVLGREPEARPRAKPMPRRRWVLALGGIAGVAAIVVLVVLLAGRHPAAPRTQPSTPAAASESPRGGPGPSPPPLNSAVEVTPARGTVVATVPDVLVRTGGGNPRLAVGEGAVWVRSTGIVQIDEQTGKVVRTIEAGGNTFGTALSLAVGDRTVWIPSSTPAPNAASDATLVPVDPATGEELRTIPIARGTVATDAAVGAGRVWVTLSNGTLVGVDPGTSAVVHRFRIGGELDTLAIGFGSVWVLDEVAGAATRVDPRSGKPLAEVTVSGNAKVLAAGLGGMWVLDTFAGTVASIDPATNRLGPSIRVGDQPTGMAVGLGAVWVSDAGGSIYRVDPITRDSSTIPIGAPLTAIAVDPATRSLWLAVGGA
jgi:streptogramin lyase/predicted Ser/Thr protein kinase